MSKTKGIIKIICVIAILSFFMDILVCWKGIHKTYYKYENAKLTSSIKAVQLSDLHNSQFGKENSRLIQRVREEQPDVIFMTGDILNEDEECTDILENLIRELKEIAPVYFSFGNHEVTYVKNRDNKDSFIQLVEAAGARVLEQEYVDTTINGQDVRIGGLYGYVLADSSEHSWMDGSEQRFMEDFQDTDRFKILLSHIPEGLLLWKSMEHWKVDLVFSGHVHGGQIRLPFIGGLYEPEQGFFPTTSTKGMIPCGNGTMILTAGLGSSGWMPRINNIPEIVVCEMHEG